MVKLVSWNLNGIRACCKNGFLDWLKASDADFFAFQEVRAAEDQMPVEIREHGIFDIHWFAAQKKGYSGTAIFGRQPARQVIHGMNTDEFDAEGRVISVEYDKLVFVSAYFPNSQDAGARIQYKIRFCERIHAWVDELQTRLKKPVILAGDYNIAHQPVDLARPKENEGTAGYLPEEREWMGHFLKSGWVDSFRDQNPEAKDRYSWWSMRTRARDRNIGWRIDYHTIHSKYRDLIVGADIHDKVTGSDHCPVTLSLNL